MKRERLVILLGLLVALVFFYFGLNEWLKSKEEQVKPPPVVVKPAPSQRETPPAPSPSAEKPKQEGVAGMLYKLCGGRVCVDDRTIKILIKLFKDFLCPLAFQGSPPSWCV